MYFMSPNEKNSTKISLANIIAALRARTHVMQLE